MPSEAATCDTLLFVSRLAEKVATAMHCNLKAAGRRAGRSQL